MPIIQENPTYFSDKSAAAVLALNSQKATQRQQKPRCGINTFGARRKVSVTSYEDAEEGSEMETFLSSCESNNSYNGAETSTNPASLSSRGLLRSSSHKSYNSNTNNTTNDYTYGSLKRNKNKYPPNTASLVDNDQNQPSKLSGMSSLTRLGQLFKKSKSKSSVGSESHASTIESSGIGSPTCTPDSSLSIYTNSLDGDSHSSSNSNQISPKHLEESMENKFCSTYTFDDCGIFAANMYYNVGESSVFTIYHQHNNGLANGGNNSGGRAIATSSRGTNATGEGAAYSVAGRDDEFEDCVQPYYNNTTFSTFPNPKRCSVASAASTTTSSVVPVPLSHVNENRPPCITGKPTTGPHAYSIQHDRDGYLRPNEPSNMRNVKNLYINGSVIGNANGQVQQVQVDVHTPTSPTSSTNRKRNALPFSESNNSSGSGGFNTSAASSSGVNGSSRYHFDSAGSSTSAATTLLAGGSNNFLCRLPEDDTIDGMIKSNSHNRNGQLPVYMNRAYFGSNSTLPITNRSLSLGALHHSQQQQQQQHYQRISSTSVSADCEPYCSLCASSIMGSPRQRSKMDVAIVKCKECFFSQKAESHIQGFFDKLMTEDKQKMDVTLKSYDLKDLDHPTDRVVVHSAKVQIVIISHHFLQRLKDEASRRPRLSPINRVFRSKNVIAILLAVTAREVTDGYESVLPRFREWFSVDLRSTNKYDQEFCKKFTEQVIRIYNVELSNSSNFSVFPKKVTREQPKIAIVFKKPVETTDEVRVELKTAKQANVISQVKLENPHTALLRIPESLSPDREAIVDVSIFVNNNKIGGSRIKSELNMKRFDEDDVDRMAKSLPPFMDWLDKHIAERLMKHYKDCTDYTADPELELMNGIIICKADSLPTIMHFAAFYGLRKTAFTVLEEADGLPHCNIRNEFDETPADIAFARGHTQIGQLIGDYQEISNSYTAYRYIKDMVEKDTETSTELDTLDNESMNDTEQFHDSSLPEESQTEHFDENIEQENSEDTGNILVAPEITTQSSLSDDESVTKGSGSDEEPTEALPPTPTTRRAKTVQTKHRQIYVNVNGNPADNPEAVQQREKKKHMTSPALPEKRLSMIQTKCLNYDVPRMTDQDYTVPPPELRPVDQSHESSVNAPVLISKHQGHFITASGYLIMNDGDAKETPVDEGSTLPIASVRPEKPPRQLSPQLPSTSTSNTSGAEGNVSTSRSDLRELMATRGGRNNGTVALDAADEQLIELINDFKNNTYDLKMVELLFENWKQRPDVQRSIDKKMEMLDKLREEYRNLQQRKGPKSRSVLDKIKKSLMKRKTSNAQACPPVLPTSPSRLREPVDASINSTGVVSPTTLTFTGPYLPSQAVTQPNPSPPVQNPHVMEQPRVSELSYRTSIDSRFSDSSADSDKPTSETSTNSSKIAAPTPVEYNNPMSKRFIPSYVPPTLVSPTVSAENINSTSEPTPSTSTSFDASYQVPPPPRPVKPSKKLPTEEQRVSPSASRTPPEVLDEPAPALPPSMSRTPPTVPAKPIPKYLGTEPTSPPPAPPPRTSNVSNVFSYIDYKRKNQEANESGSSSVKMSYENMNE